MKKIPLKFFFQRVKSEEGFDPEDDSIINCWVVDTELEDYFVNEVKESIQVPIFSCAVWFGYVVVEDDEIVNIEGEWRDVTNKFEEFVVHVMNEDQERPDL